MVTKSRYLLILLFGIFLLSFSSAETFGYNLLPEPTFNNNTAFVNNTENCGGIPCEDYLLKYTNIGGRITNITPAQGSQAAKFETNNNFEFWTDSVRRMFIGDSSVPTRVYGNLSLLFTSGRDASLHVDNDTTIGGDLNMTEGNITDVDYFQNDVLDIRDNYIETRANEDLYLPQKIRPDSVQVGFVSWTGNDFFGFSPLNFNAGINLPGSNVLRFSNNVNMIQFGFLGGTVYQSGFHSLTVGTTQETYYGNNFQEFLNKAGTGSNGNVKTKWDEVEKFKIEIIGFGDVVNFSSNDTNMSKDLNLINDDQKLCFGNDMDACIRWNGNRMIVNSTNTTFTGDLVVNGSIIDLTWFYDENKLGNDSLLYVYNSSDLINEDGSHNHSGLPDFMKTEISVNDPDKPIYETRYKQVQIGTTPNKTALDNCIAETINENSTLEDIEMLTNLCNDFTKIIIYETRSYQEIIGYEQKIIEGRDMSVAIGLTGDQINRLKQERDKLKQKSQLLEELIDQARTTIQTQNQRLNELESAKEQEESCLMSATSLADYRSCRLG